MNKFLCVVLLLVSQSVFGRWDRVASMNVPVGCGFFFDANIGLVGSGNFGGPGTIPNYQLRIWRTTNGGNSWTQCSTPNGTGRVTSIHMRDATVGYASIFSSTYSLWKTTDGGITWRDHTQGENGTSVCVHATSNRIIKTMWNRNNTGAGGVSSNDGATFNNVFQSQFSEDSYNGIDFMDDMNGIVVPGPDPNNPVCLITNDGGQTWRRGGILDESWGIYAAHGHNIYLTLAEGDATNDQTLVRVTSDGGVTWQTRYPFPNGWGDPGFSGHIAGKGTTVYVQTTSDGLRRSDNLGLNWKGVGGPDNQRDTRFVVTGCQGEVVFAFDNAGGIWRTTDGGDGTLSGGNSGAGPLSMSTDSILINTFYCQPELGFVTLSVPPCALFAVDSIYITSLQNEFTTDSTKKFTVTENSSVTVPVRFQYGSSATRKGVLHFKGRIGGRQIDTTIILIGKNATAPEPFIGSLSSVSAGDTAYIPIHLKPTIDTFTIKRYRLHLSYNTDLLSCEDFDVIGTLSNPIISAEVKNDANGAEFICELRNPITEKSNLTLPIIQLVMRTYVTSTLETTIRLDTFSISSQAPLPLCTIPTKPYQVIKYECGDSMLVQLMRDGNIPELSFIKPNPVIGRAMIVGVKMHNEIPVSFEIVDMQGKVVAKLSELFLSKGLHEIPFDTSTLPTGSYMISLRVGSTILASSRVSIQK